MIDFEILDTATLQLAKKGDLRRLTEKLRSSRPMRQDERDFIADMLEGKVRFKRGRKEQFPFLDVEVVVAVRWLERVEGWARDAAVVRIAELIGETERNVRHREKRAEVWLQFGSLQSGSFMRCYGNETGFRASKAEGAADAELNRFRPSLFRNPKKQE